MEKEKVAVFITVFNEEKVLEDLLSFIDDSYDLYVVDDGSNDRTGDIAKRGGAEVISHPINMGQGITVLTAFKLLAKKDYDIIVEMDGDGQHDPREIPRFIDKIRETGTDIVAGSRLLGTNYEGAPFARRLFLSPLTWVLNRLTGYSISDSMCGFRAFKGSALKSAAHLFDDMAEPEYIASEMWIKFARASLTAGEVPIRLAGRKHGVSYKGLFRYARGVIATIIRSKLETYKHKYKNNRVNADNNRRQEA